MTEFSTFIVQNISASTFNSFFCCIYFKFLFLWADYLLLHTFIKVFLSACLCFDITYGNLRHGWFLLIITKLLFSLKIICAHLICCHCRGWKLFVALFYINFCYSLSVVYAVMHLNFLYLLFSLFACSFLTVSSSSFLALNFCARKFVVASFWVINLKVVCRLIWIHINNYFC